MLLFAHSLTELMSGGSYSILGGDYDRAGAASRSLKDRLKRIGVDAEIIRRAMIAAYEAEMNVVIHAHKGTMRFTFEPAQILIEVADEGPGIPDIERAMQEGFSTAPPAARELGFGAGMGLPNIKRNSDRFRIHSTVGLGTRLDIQIDLKAQTVPASAHNSVHVVIESCRQCLHCVRACPTKAMRVRGGRPEILDHLCIDCTTCIEACRDGALTMAGAQPLPKRLDRMVCVIPPSFLAQFGASAGPKRVLKALRELGFGDVLVTQAHEEALRQAVLDYARKEAKAAPVISPVCPAVVNLIETRFQSLIKNVAPYLSPIEAARHEMKGQECLFVAACPGQGTALTIHSPSEGGHVVAPASLRQAVLPLVAEGGMEDAGSQEEPVAANAPGLLEVSGIRHVVNVLEQAENGFLADIPVLELYACDHGCFGSPLLWGDPFVARRRWLQNPHVGAQSHQQAMRRKTPYSARAGLRLDANMSKAILKLGQIDEVTKSLPGRDCALCGAPTCASLAEDIVLGVAFRSACMHLSEREEKAK